MPPVPFWMGLSFDSTSSPSYSGEHDLVSVNWLWQICDCPIISSIILTLPDICDHITLVAQASHCCRHFIFNVLDPTNGWNYVCD